MLILALDTSGDTCSVAVSDESACFVEYAFRHQRHLSERLPAIIEFVLHDAGTSLKGIDAFAVGLGPGSFTGVRVGVTMAKVWAMTLDKPVVGVSSLDALVEPLALAGLPLVAVAPTRRTESIAAFYAPNTGTSLAPPAVVANLAIASAARAAIFGDGTVDRHLIVIGEHAQTIYDASTELERTWLRVSRSPISAAAIARLAVPHLARGDSDDVDTLIPLYVTPPPTG